ncbi:MAG: DNA polymerase III subunit delta [Clostridia bacterium]|nr:DNA polymerase III subunit delta [Clostridia bacterium]
MTENEFKQELKSLSGGYLFHGEEDYLKYSYSKEVRNLILDGSFDEFNHIVLYGEDFSASALINALATLPMMAEKKLVEVRGVDFKSFKKDEWTELTDALSHINEYDHTILIIRADTWGFDEGNLPKRPSEMYKTLTKHLKAVEFKFPQSARLRAWIMRHFTHGKVEFNQELCDYLVQICGHDMWALSNEIAKLCSYALQKGISIKDKSIIDDVCCKTVEYDDFQLTNSLLEGSKALVFETLKRQKLNKEPPNLILYTVIRMYTEMYAVMRQYKSGMSKERIASSLKIHEFKVGKYINRIAKMSPQRIERSLELCREADVSSKSFGNLTGYIPVERLISMLLILRGN